VPPAPDGWWPMRPPEVAARNAALQGTQR
jgi:hypothetical protein